VLVALRLVVGDGSDVCIYGLAVDVVLKTLFGRTALALACEPATRLVFVNILSSGPSGASGASGLSSGFGFGGLGRDGFEGGDGGFGAGAGGAGLGAGGGGGGGGAAAIAARLCSGLETSLAHVVCTAPSRRSRSDENNIVNVRVGVGVNDLYMDIYPAVNRPLSKPSYSLFRFHA
jgi:hypothetical protein